jgi:hypothetical protein
MSFLSSFPLYQVYLSLLQLAQFVKRAFLVWLTIPFWQRRQSRAVSRGRVVISCSMRVGLA